MPPIEWNEELSVGNVVLDEQHRHLIALVNALSSSSEDANSETADIVLEHLARFLAFHFETEESILQRIDYPDLQEHVEEHKALLDKLSRHVTEMHAAGTTSIQSVSELLWAWVDYHMTTTDQRFASYLRKSKGDSA